MKQQQINATRQTYGGEKYPAWLCHQCHYCWLFSMNLRQCHHHHSSAHSIKSDQHRSCCLLLVMLFEREGIKYLGTDPNKWHNKLLTHNPCTQTCPCSPTRFAVIVVCCVSNAAIDDKWKEREVRYFQGEHGLQIRRQTHQRRSQFQIAYTPVSP